MWCERAGEWIVFVGTEHGAAALRVCLCVVELHRPSPTVAGGRVWVTKVGRRVDCVEAGRMVLPLRPMTSDKLRYTRFEKAARDWASVHPPEM